MSEPLAATTLFGWPPDIGLVRDAAIFLFLLAGTVISLFRDVRAGRSLRRRALRASGTVTGRRERARDDGRITYSAVVTYTTRTGRKVEATMPNETLYPTRRGTVVPVLYDPADPGKVRVDRLWQRGPFASVVFIVAITAFAALWLWTVLGGTW